MGKDKELEGTEFREMWEDDSEPVSNSFDYFILFELQKSLLS